MGDNVPAGRGETVSPRLPWYEFFAGGGMARLGLGPAWECTFANDWCAKKADSYRAVFGGSELRVCDVAELRAGDLPGTPALVWASFPCQDLSLAGLGAGLNGSRSGAFRPFWRLMTSLLDCGRVPRLIVLENVTGALTSHGGQDFAFILSALAEAGYATGALVMDAVRFVPQSRPRLFIVACAGSPQTSEALASSGPSEAWHPKSLRVAHARLPRALRDRWIWWRVPEPNVTVPELSALIEDEPLGAPWHSKEQTARLVGLMAPLHRARLAAAQRAGKRIIGTVYKRTRPDGEGGRAQRAEIRFDQISGCLRTPAGGSSRQVIVVVDGRTVRSRLLSPREAARLMGAPESYPVPANPNDAYHLFGDGVVVPVVSWLEQYLLLPLALSEKTAKAA